MSNDTDHVDHSRWAAFRDGHAAFFNSPVLEAMIEDIREIQAGMTEHIKPIIKGDK